MNGRLLQGCLLASVGITCAQAASQLASEREAPASASMDRWEFSVMLDEREIGHHSFERRFEGDREEIAIEARFEVKVLFFTAYRYVHDNLETWEGNCLSEIRSKTDDNGTPYSLAGEESSGGFLLLRNESPADVSLDCVKTFAYWNPHILEADQLLNAQTGEVKPVSIDHRGERELEVGGRMVLSDEYVISTPQADITVWYQQDNRQWLGLETTAAGDRVLRYKALQVPEMPSGDRPPAGRTTVATVSVSS